MPVSVQYDNDGKLLGMTRYPESKNAPVMPVDRNQIIFAEDAFEIQNLNLAKKEMNVDRTGFIDRIKTDYELLLETYSVKGLITMSDIDANAALIEIRTFELRDGEYVKKVV